MKYSILIAILFIGFSSCKKKTIEYVNTNNSKDSLTYQPKVPGSKWSYLLSSSLINKTYNTTRQNYDTVFNGKTYAVFFSEFELEGTQYVRQDGDKYYSVLTTSTNKTELLMLDAAKGVNDTWVGGVNGTDTYYYTIVDKFPVYTLDGFTFKNVIHVKMERKDASNAVTLSAEGYFAQGVGQIISKGDLVGIPFETKLISVDLK
jgi:hypothetical protein